MSCLRSANGVSYRLDVLVESKVAMSAPHTLDTKPGVPEGKVNEHDVQHRRLRFGCY